MNSGSFVVSTFSHSMNLCPFMRTCTYINVSPHLTLIRKAPFFLVSIHYINYSTDGEAGTTRVV